MCVPFRERMTKLCLPPEIAAARIQGLDALRQYIDQSVFPVHTPETDESAAKEAPGVHNNEVCKAIETERQRMHEVRACFSVAVRLCSRVMMECCRVISWLFPMALSAARCSSMHLAHTAPLVISFAARLALLSMTSPFPGPGSLARSPTSTITSSSLI